MDTEFVEVTIENYGSFVGKHVLKLSNGSTLNFIKGRNKVEPRLGSNDAGKSTLLNAIPWCLYGKTTNDLGSTDIRPWGAKGKSSVTVKLITWDGDEGARHTIVRTAGPNSLTLNGKPCSQADIDKLIGVPLDVFRLSTFLGQGRDLFHDLPNREKMEFLVNVLQLDRWDRYSDRAKEQAQLIGRKLDQVELQVEANKARAIELANQVSRQKEVSDAWEQERADKLDEAGAIVAKLHKQAEAATTTHGAVQVKLDEAELKGNQSQTDLRKFSDAAHKAEAEHSRLLSHSIKLEEEVLQAEAQLRALEESRTCPTCGQKISRESRYLDNLEAVQTKHRALKKEIGSKAVNEAEKAATKARTKYEEQAKIAKQLRDTATALRGEERLLLQQRDQYVIELKHAKRTRDEYADGVNPHRDRLAELRKAHKRALDDNAKLADEQVDLEVKLDRASFWIKGFKDVRLFILEDVLEELQFATNSMLDAIGLIGWEVSYAVERETKSGTLQRGLVVTVLSPRKNGDTKWKAWGGGVGQRLRLAGALALSEVLLARAGVECNIEVLDEPTRHLSPVGVDDLCDFLADRARTLKKSIYLVDHMAIESTRFDRTITVVKTEDGSSIVGG